MKSLLFFLLIACFTAVVFTHTEQLWEDVSFEAISKTNKCPIYCNCLDKTVVNSYINSDANEKCIAHFALEFVLDKNACPLSRFTLGLPVDSVSLVNVTADSCIKTISERRPSDERDCNSTEDYGDYNAFYFDFDEECRLQHGYGDDDNNDEDRPGSGQRPWNVEFYMPGLKVGTHPRAPLHLYGGFHCNGCILEGVLLPEFYEPECVQDSDCGEQTNNPCKVAKCVDQADIIPGSQCGGVCEVYDIPGCFETTCGGSGGRSCPTDFIETQRAADPCLLPNPICTQGDTNTPDTCQFDIREPCFACHEQYLIDNSIPNHNSTAGRDHYCQASFTQWEANVASGQEPPASQDFQCAQEWICSGDEPLQDGHPAQYDPTFAAFCEPVQSADTEACCSQIGANGDTECTDAGYSSCCDECESSALCAVLADNNNEFTCSVAGFNQRTCADFKGAVDGGDGDDADVVGGAVGGTLGAAAIVLALLVVLALCGACVGVVLAVSLFVWGFKKTRRTLKNLEALGFTPEEARLITSSPVYDQDTGAPNPLFATHDRLGGSS